MRNHPSTNNNKLINQKFGSNLKLEVGNDIGPKFLGSKTLQTLGTREIILEPILRSNQLCSKKSLTTT